MRKKTNRSNFYIDEEEFERVFEIRIRDLRERKGVKQKSFSVSVKKGTKDSDYADADRIKEILQAAIKSFDIKDSNANNRGSLKK